MLLFIVKKTINFEGLYFHIFKLNPEKHMSHAGGENWAITFVLFTMTSGPNSLLGGN